ISDFVRNTLSEWGSPGGVSVVVVRKTDLDSSRGGHDGLGWVVETKGYGNADLAGKVPITDSSLFSIGSNSKLVTAIATGLLISNESLTPRITWKTKLGSLIPEWQLVDPIAHQESTILDALSHRTGLLRHDLAYNKDDSIQTLFKRLRNLKPSASFRDIWQYNNIMYCAVSYLPSKLLPSHIPFARYVKEHLFDKLQMHDTTYSYDEVQATGRLVSGLAREHVDPANPFAPGITRVTPYWITTGGEDGNFMAGAGGVISSGKDLAIWLQMLLLGGVHPSTNETIVPEAVLDTISTGYSIPMGRRSVHHLRTAQSPTLTSHK
ncbi:beta-lactamase/transpeptidase-like protein, partial [Pluteus cervinus]